MFNVSSLIKEAYDLIVSIRVICSFLNKNLRGFYFYILYICILIILYFYYLSIGIKSAFIYVSLIDLFIKLFWQAGGIDNLKYLIFIPITQSKKELIFFIIPMLSIWNIFIFLGVYYCNLSFIIILLINSYTVFFTKLNYNKLEYYIIFFMIFYMIWIFYEKIIMIPTLFFIIFFIYGSGRKLLKLNRL